MDNLANVPPLTICSRVMAVFLGSIVYLYMVAAWVGPERKAAWFRKRKKYTFLNRRGVFGEDINFGYPVCWQGVLVFLLIIGGIFGFGYWYIFLLPY